MIPVAKPYMTRSDERAVSAVIRSGWILQGPAVEKFEHTIATYTNLPYAVATSSCTTAMHLGLIAAGIKPGDEIIVPSFSFIATANCVVHAGATPVFADIDPATYTIDPAAIEQTITKKTKGILVVHQVGLAAPMVQIMKIARSHNLLVFEDCACALGTTINDIHVGNFGIWGAFSFHPRKAITTAEGGMLVTKNKKIATTVSMLRAHGADMDVKKRDASKHVLIEQYPLIGYNFRMSDVHAALGLSQYNNLSAILASRQLLAQRYNRAFAGHPRLVTPYAPQGYVHAYQSYLLRVKGGRDRLMQKLLDAGIATRRGIPSAHLEAPYKKRYPRLKLPMTQIATAETITIPLYYGMTRKDQDFVIDRILTYA